MKNNDKDSVQNKDLEKVLIALQGLYFDTHKTADEVKILRDQLIEVQKILLLILKYYEKTIDFEKHLFDKPS